MPCAIALQGNQTRHVSMQAELERILEENNKLLEKAKANPAGEGEPEAESAAAEKLQSLVSVAAPGNGRGLGDDVYVLGAAKSAKQ